MNKQPRILFIATLPPPIHGSAVVSQQLKESKIINHTFRCDWVNLATSRNMEEAGKLSLTKVWRIFSSLSYEFWLLLTRKYDLCYISLTCYGPGFLKDAPFAMLCKMFGKKLLIHQHNKGMTHYVDRMLYRKLLPLIYKNSRVILLSWYLYPDIERIVPKENVIICPNGIDVRINNCGNNERKRYNSTPRLLFLSNLLESKGVLVLLDALSLLADKGCSFRCDFVGGETKEINGRRFEDEVNKRHLNRFVFYQGRKTGSEKHEALDNCDIFVFPSYNETFGLVLLEAMFHKLPCVTTDEGGIPDIIKDGVNGLVCKRKDPISLAENIERLFNDYSLCKLMGEEGYKILMNNYTETIFETRISNIFKEVIKS